MQPASNEGDKQGRPPAPKYSDRMDEYYLAYEDRPSEPDYRMHGQATLNLADGTTSSDNLSVSQSSFAHPGPMTSTLNSHTTEELQRSRVFDGRERTPTPQSTHKGVFVQHPITDTEPINPPKPQMDLSMPNVDPDDSFSSSYRTSHTGQPLSLHDLASPSPNITFQSRVTFEDGEKNRTPHQSTQKENYINLPLPENNSHPPPKAQVNLSMPNVDPKDSYHSSYKMSHTGELPHPNDMASPAPATTFQSRVAFEDGDKNRAPHQSTQKGNYVAHPITDQEPHPAPKSQLDLSMPYVDSKAEYQSSYKQSHKGEPAEDGVAISRTAFHSSLVLEDLEHAPIPQSTQRGQYVAYAAQEPESQRPRMAQLDLTMPHVDPRDEYHSSYQRSHTGERPSAEDEFDPPLPRTAFQSAIVFEGGETTPHQSTQKGNYVAYQLPDAEPRPPPSPQVDLSMPNVDPSDSYHSSYQTSHTGAALSPDDMALPAPNSTFQSSVVFGDGNKTRTPLQSTQKGNYVAHPAQDTTPPVPPKPQIRLSMPNVDPKDTYCSSYKTSHNGAAPLSDDVASPAANSAFQSRVVFEDGSHNRTNESTQKGNYVAHPVVDQEPHPPPKPQVNLSMPNVDPLDSFQSSYRQAHKGEKISPDNEQAPITRTAFQSTVSLEAGEKVLHQSTQHGNYVAHPVQATTPPLARRPQVDLSMPSVDPAEFFQSSYNHAHRGEALPVNDDHVPVVRTAFQSSVVLEGGEKVAYQSTQKGNYVAHPVQESGPHPPPKPQVDLTQPNMDPKDQYQSSYKHSHKGEKQSAEHEHASISHTAFQSNVVFEGGDRIPSQSTHKQSYMAHPVQEAVAHSPSKPQVDLSQPNADTKDTFLSSYKMTHRGEAPSVSDEVAAAPQSSFTSSFTFDDGDKHRTPPKSTQKDNYVSYPAQDQEPRTPSKAQISFKHSDVDLKDAYQSSYNNAHKREALSMGEETVASPNTALKSSVVLEDGYHTKTPTKSTQRENYVAHPTSDIELYVPPKSQISFAQPNVDPKDTYQSSYKHSHKGEAPPAEDEVVAALRTTFKSSVAFEDGVRPKTPQKSTQRENYVAHATPEREHHVPPQSQITLSQPSVDPTESYQSSYNRVYTGEAPSINDEVTPLHTAFKSSMVFGDGERTRTPQKSTQRENYVSHPISEAEHHTPPKSLISLAQPNVDPKETFQSSYKQSHKGEALLNDSDVTLFPHTAFKSSFTFDDGEKYRATQQSTHNENYKSYPTPDMEHYTPPKPQISLTQPNLDPKETFQSSYKQSHKGEALSSDDQTTSAPQTTFKSSVAFDDGEKTRTPQKSTQRDNYVLHPTPDIEHYTPPKSQISLTPDSSPHHSPKPQVNLTMPHVDPKDSFQTSYRNTHKGEPLPPDDEVSPLQHTAFQSNFSLEEGYKTPQTTQKGNFVVHPVSKPEPHPSPKPQVSLTQPNVTSKDTFQSSYKTTHRGESPVPDNTPRTPPRTAFKSSITLDAGHALEPLETTSKNSYTAPTVREQDHARGGEAHNARRSSFTMGSDASPRMSTSASTYARPPQEAILNASPSKPSKNAWESSVSLSDKENNKHFPVPTSREAYSPRLNATQNAPSRPRPTTSQLSLGQDQTSYYHTTSASSFSSRSPNLPKPESPARKTGDLHKSSIQLSSGEPTRMSTTSQTSYSASPAEPLPPRSPTPTSPTPKRSSFSFGSEQSSYQTTARTMYSSPPSSPSRSSSPSVTSPSPSPSRSPARSPLPTTSPSRHSHLRSSFSLG